MPRFEEKVGARLRRDPSDLASYYSCSFIKRDSGGNSNSILLPSPSSKMVILVQRPFERVLSRGLTVAVYSSLFDRSKSKRMDPSQEQKKNIYIYIYTSGTRIYSWWVPVQIVTSLTVLLVLPIRISSSSLSLSSCSNISARLRICEPDDMS